MLLFNQHVVSASKVLAVFPWILEVNASKEEKKSLSAFVLDSKTKEDDKIVLRRVGFEICRERQAAPTTIKRNG